MPRFQALLELDADLADAVPAAELPDARRLATVPVVTVAAGPCDARILEADDVADEPFAALVIEGVVVQNVELGGRLASQLIGPGDIIVPWGLGLEPPATRFALTAADRTRLGILDRRFLIITRRWPQIAAALLLRAQQQNQRVGVQHAITQLSRVEDRILATMWHLAQRWGTVTPQGTVLSLSLTHETLGRLVGARRPTVTLALTALASSDSVLRRPDGSWLLRDTGMLERTLPATVHPGVVTVVEVGSAPDAIPADRAASPAQRDALLARIVALREIQRQVGDRVKESLRRAGAVREETEQLRARLRSDSPTPVGSARSGAAR